jgi:hypothetical protein
MKQRVNVYLIGLALIAVWSCGNNKSSKDILISGNRVVQQGDGTISLKLEKAACYTDVVNPSSNTAEWNIVIANPGRFNIWLSSATKDTTALHYANSVKITLLDKQLEVKPACDKIVHNTGELPSAYFRADSYMGSFFVEEPGEYNIQVISEKVIAKNSVTPKTSQADDTMLMSVNLTPKTR